MPNPETPNPAASAVSIQLFGIGGAGVNALEHMAGTDLGALPCAALHTNERVLARSSLSRKVLLGPNLLHGLGAGGDPALGKAAAEQDAAQWTSLLEKTDLVFLIAGLGGGTATGAAPVIARAAKETGALVLAIATWPFDFEGKRRQQQAHLGFHALKNAADAVICLPNQKLFKLLHENTRLLDAFELTNHFLAQGVRGIWQMLIRPGLLRVDFSDLCAVTRGRQAESSFAYVEAEGENRPRVLLEKLLASPLLDGGQTIAEADALLVNLVGGPDLTMAEINRVMEELNRQSETAQLVVGAAIDPAAAGKLALTLISTKRTKDDKGARTCDLYPRSDAAAPALQETTEFDSAFFHSPAPARSSSRFLPPPPPLTAETAEHLLGRQKSGAARSARKNAGLWQQGQLPLEIVSKGRFEKIEPTVHRGEDLDVPTYIRRGVPLN